MSTVFLFVYLLQEQKFGSSLNKANLHNNFSDKTLGIYINKYAVDVTPSHSHRSKYKFQRHFQPSQSFYRHVRSKI